MNENCVRAQDQSAVIPIPPQRPDKFYVSPRYLKKLLLRQRPQHYNHSVDTTILDDKDVKTSLPLSHDDFFEPSARNIVDMIKPQQN